MIIPSSFSSFSNSTSGSSFRNASSGKPREGKSLPGNFSWKKYRRPERSHRCARIRAQRFSPRMPKTKPHYFCLPLPNRIQPAIAAVQAIAPGPRPFYFAGFRKGPKKQNLCREVDVLPVRSPYRATFCLSRRFKRLLPPRRAYRRPREIRDAESTASAHAWYAITGSGRRQAVTSGFRVRVLEKLLERLHPRFFRRLGGWRIPFEV